MDKSLEKIIHNYTREAGVGDRARMGEEGPPEGIWRIRSTAVSPHHGKQSGKISGRV